jgi:tetratricopeptide (TPR) repeat protein
MYGTRTIRTIRTCQEKLRKPFFRLRYVLNVRQYICVVESSILARLTSLASHQNKEFASITEDLIKTLAAQKAHPHRGNNRYLCGITAHNLGVIRVLAGADDEAAHIFRQAITLKSTSFGPEHPEVALSWDELGIQFFARGDFASALSAFHEAHTIRSKQEGSSSHPNLAMVLNNLACCHFQMGSHRTALLKLQEASEIQHKAVGSSAQADLDLLHVAIVVCNCGYLNLALKQYEDARSLFEDALLIQQSVLDDNHRAVRDTLSNIDFTNAFHS